MNGLLQSLSSHTSRPGKRQGTQCSQVHLGVNGRSVRAPMAEQFPDLVKRCAFPKQISRQCVAEEMGAFADTNRCQRGSVPA